MKIDLISYIVSRTPQGFVTKVVEELEAAYSQAFQHSETFAVKSRRRVLGQLRHYRQNDALLSAGASMGQMVSARSTSPAGEHYSFVSAQDIRFGRIAVPFNNRIPRPAKHRKAIAALNARFEPKNSDLFLPHQAPISDGLGCLFITVNPHSGEAQSVPASLIVGVPHTNLKGWHLFEPISEILAAYNPPQEIEVQDLAWVKLKKQLGG
jgi:hypothetical protein